MPDQTKDTHAQGAEVRDDAEPDVTDPEAQDNPDEGPAMTGAGAEPSGNSMDHWATAMPNADATKPETMPKRLGGSGETQNPSESSNPA